MHRLAEGDSFDEICAVKVLEATSSAPVFSYLLESRPVDRSLFTHEKFPRLLSAWLNQMEATGTAPFDQLQIETVPGVLLTKEMIKRLRLLILDTVAVEHQCETQLVSSEVTRRIECRWQAMYHLFLSLAPLELINVVEIFRSLCTLVDPQTGMHCTCDRHLWLISQSANVVNSLLTSIAQSSAPPFLAKIALFHSSRGQFDIAASPSAFVHSASIACILRRVLLKGGSVHQPDLDAIMEPWSESVRPLSQLLQSYEENLKLLTARFQIAEHVYLTLQEYVQLILVSQVSSKQAAPLLTQWLTTNHSPPADEGDYLTELNHDLLALLPVKLTYILVRSIIEQGVKHDRPPAHHSGFDYQSPRATQFIAWSLRSVPFSIQQFFLPAHLLNHFSTLPSLESNRVVQLLTFLCKSNSFILSMRLEDRLSFLVAAAQLCREGKVGAECYRLFKAFCATLLSNVISTHVLIGFGRSCALKRAIDFGENVPLNQLVMFNLSKSLFDGLPGPRHAVKTAVKAQLESMKAMLHNPKASWVAKSVKCFHPIAGDDIPLGLDEMTEHTEGFSDDDVLRAQEIRDRISSSLNLSGTLWKDQSIGAADFEFFYNNHHFYAIILHGELLTSGSSNLNVSSVKEIVSAFANASNIKVQDNCIISLVRFCAAFLVLESPSIGQQWSTTQSDCMGEEVVQRLLARLDQMFFEHGFAHFSDMLFALSMGSGELELAHLVLLDCVCTLFAGRVRDLMQSHDLAHKSLLLTAIKQAAYRFIEAQHAESLKRLLHHYANILRSESTDNLSFLCTVLRCFDSSTALIPETRLQLYSIFQTLESPLNLQMIVRDLLDASQSTSFVAMSPNPSSFREIPNPVTYVCTVARARILTLSIEPPLLLDAFASSWALCSASRDTLVSLQAQVLTLLPERYTAAAVAATQRLALNWPATPANVEYLVALLRAVVFLVPFNAFTLVVLQLLKTQTTSFAGLLFLWRCCTPILQFINDDELQKCVSLLRDSVTQIGTLRNLSYVRRTELESANVLQRIVSKFQSATQK